jgi:hypothetical protein
MNALCIRFKPIAMRVMPIVDVNVVQEKMTIAESCKSNSYEFVAGTDIWRQA